MVDVRPPILMRTSNNLQRHLDIPNINLGAENDKSFTFDLLLSRALGQSFQNHFDSMIKFWNLALYLEKLDISFPKRYTNFYTKEMLLLLKLTITVESSHTFE